MADVFTKAKRSEVMSRIRSRGNRDTELALASLFRRHTITGWRKQVQVRIAERGVRSSGALRSARPALRVKPDFVFRKARVTVFVDGCFWHGCPRHATWPANRAAWWRRKIKGNQTRDRLVNRTLRRAGWRVIRIWEHELHKRGVRNAERGTARLVRRIQAALSG